MSLWLLGIPVCFLSVARVTGAQQQLYQLSHLDLIAKRNTDG